MFKCSLDPLLTLFLYVYDIFVRLKTKLGKLNNFRVVCTRNRHRQVRKYRFIGFSLITIGIRHEHGNIYLNYFIRCLYPVRTSARGWRWSKVAWFNLRCFQDVLPLSFQLFRFKSINWLMKSKNCFCII